MALETSTLAATLSSTVGTSWQPWGDPGSGPPAIQFGVTLAAAHQKCCAAAVLFPPTPCLWHSVLEQSARYPPPREEGEKPNRTAPPPPRAAAGNPVPLRRPTVPAATCPWEGSNPTPETWDHLLRPHLTRRVYLTTGGLKVPLKEPVRQPPVGLVRLGRDVGGSVLQQSTSAVPASDDRTCQAEGCVRERYTLTSDTPADWLNGPQDGAPMVATHQVAINRCPLNAAVKPWGRVRLRTLPGRQKFVHGG